MSSHRCLSVLALFFGILSTARGQEPTTETIRAMIRDLEGKLQVIEQKNQADQNVRTTRIGETRPAPVVEEHRLVLQVYDLSDLFVVAPAYTAQHHSPLSSMSRPVFPVISSARSGEPAGGGFGGGGFGGGGFGGGGMGGMSGGMGGGGGGFFAVPEDVQKKSSRPDQLFQFGGVAAEGTTDGSPPPSSRVALDDLIDTIQQTIAPDKWDDAGGSSSIAKLGNSLVISTTADVHRQIGKLLQLFRKRWATLRTVSVRASWLWLTEQELSGLLIPANREKNQEVTAAVPFGLVIDDQWKKLLSRERDPADARPDHYFGSITGYNGQTVHTLAGRQQQFVASVTPIVGNGPNQIGYSPTIAMVQEGAVLQVTPLTTANAKYVVLDVHSQVSQLHSLANKSTDEPAVQERIGAPQDVVRSLDRPIVSTHRLSTTLRIPTNRVYLVGGLSSDMASAVDAQLYLFVQVFVQELRDDPVDDDDLAAPATGDPFN